MLDFTDPITILGFLFLGDPPALAPACFAQDATLDERVSTLENYVYACFPDDENDGLPNCFEAKLDTDNDGVNDFEDNSPEDPFRCQDLDRDLCDDCSQTGGPPDVMNDGPDANQDGQCDSGSECLFVAPGSIATSDLGNQDIIYARRSSTDATFDDLTIEIYGSRGGPTAPTMFTLTGDSYANGTVCVVLRTNCNLVGECEKTFLATIGTVTIDSIGSAGASLTGSIQDINLVEVTIDNTTFESTPVPDGQTICIVDFSFDHVIQSFGF